MMAARFLGGGGASSATDRSAAGDAERNWSRAGRRDRVGALRDFLRLLPFFDAAPLRAEGSEKSSQSPAIAMTTARPMPAHVTALSTATHGRLPGLVTVGLGAHVRFGTMGAMPSTAQLLAFMATSALIVAIPGPSVLFIIGRALAQGRRSALASVAGNALGVYLQIVAVAIGLGPLIAASSTAYLVVKVIGGLYLCWLGIGAIRGRRALADALATGAPTVTKGSLRSAVLVGLTNPKVIVLFAALLPQFVNPAGRVWLQMLLLGLVFIAIALIGDGAIALSAARARDWFLRRPERAAGVAGGGGAMLVALGVWTIAHGGLGSRS